MAYSYVIKTGDGSTTQFTFNFPYIKPDHIGVTVDGTAVSFTFVDDYTVDLDTAPDDGASVKIARSTPVDNRLTKFQDASTLTAKALDKAINQDFYAVQEAYDNIADSIRKNNAGIWDAQGLRLTGLAQSEDASDALRRDEAQKHVQEAEDWANYTNGTVTRADGTTTNEYSAKYYAQNAETYKDTAKTYRDETIAVSNTMNVGVYADIRAKDPANLNQGQLAFVSGRNSSNDGGHGWFVWKSDDLSTEVANDEMASGEGDGGIFVAPTADKSGASGAWIRLIGVFAGNFLNVRWYGAIGDAATDDEPAINKSLFQVNNLGGGTVYFPVPSAGWGVNAPLSLYSNVTVLFESVSSRSDQTTNEIIPLSDFGDDVVKLFSVKAVDLYNVAVNMTNLPSRRAFYAYGLWEGYLQRCLAYNLSGSGCRGFEFAPNPDASFGILYVDLFKCEADGDADNLLGMGFRLNGQDTGSTVTSTTLKKCKSFNMSRGLEVKGTGSGCSVEDFYAEGGGNRGLSFSSTRQPFYVRGGEINNQDYGIVVSNDARVMADNLAFAVNNSDRQISGELIERYRNRLDYKVNIHQIQVSTAFRGVSYGDTVTPDVTAIRLQTGTSSVTLNGTTAIADGDDGQLLEIYGDSSQNTLTIPNGANTRLQGNSDKTLGLADVIRLRYMASYSDWIQIGGTV